MPEKLFVTWQDVENYIEIVYITYKDMNISGVYGIPRGGIILATLLSYKMDIPLLIAPAKNCILMDDIADSGETLLHYKNNTSGGGIDKKYHIVTMFYKKSSLVEPEFYMYYKNQEWIVFPWEIV